jgi:hypothetical protein
MADPETLALLSEIRDQLRQQVAGQQRAFALQEEAAANQKRLIEAQQQAFRRLRPIWLGGALVILAILAFAVALLVRLAMRYG